ncbi:MAG: hypothetical protein RIC12_01990, partial [Pirellulales bacterium]
AMMSGTKRPATRMRRHGQLLRLLASSDTAQLPLACTNSANYNTLGGDLNKVGVYLNSTSPDDTLDQGSGPQILNSLGDLGAFQTFAPQAAFPTASETCVNSSTIVLGSGIATGSSLIA